MAGSEGEGWVTFDTAIGRCGLAWRDEAVIAVTLPEAAVAATEAALARRVPGSDQADPPGVVAEVIERIVGLLEGRGDDLLDVAVDIGSRSEFVSRVYDEVRRIPPGRTLTYGQVAEAVGEPGAAQAVGRAMGANPVPIIVPCHRVVGADSRPVGFSAPGGVETKLRMLRIEGAAAGGPPSLFDP